MHSRPLPHTSDTTGRLTRLLSEKWGVPEDLASRYAAGSTELFPQVLAAAEPAVAKEDSFACPAAFAGGSDFQGFPVAAEREWRSCERALRDSGASGVMMHLPLFWQLASALHRAARAARMPAFINQPENAPLAGAALARGGIDAVVSEPRSASRLLRYLEEKKLPHPKLWLIVREAAEEDWRLPELFRSGGSAAIQEVHLYPGVVLLEQCFSQALREEPLFHASEAYAWDLADGETRITGGAGPFPLVRHRLPFVLRAAEPCRCGKEAVERI